ncbi:MAG: hypothetical protein WCT77_04685 [Bacteroidota bacterium]|jgi:YVTN family beta-propeller protein
MKTIKIFSALILTLIILSCSGKEGVIDNTNKSWYFLASVDSPNGAIMKVEMPAGTIISNDLFSEKNSRTLDGKVEKIVSFRDNIFLIIPSTFKIEVVNKTTFISVATVDYSSLGLAPTDICFANATDAYVAHGRDSVVSILDLTNFVIARQIITGSHPVAITSSGNQIFVADQLDNNIAVIDSRTHNVEAKIPVQTAPTYIATNSTGEKIIVVSLGAGKLDGTSAKSAAQVSLIDVQSRTVIKTKEIASGSTNPKDVVPSGLIVSKYDMGYISTQINLYSYDTRSGERLSFVDSSPYIMASYSSVRDELMLLNQTNETFKAVFFNLESYSETASYIFTKSVNFLFPVLN